MVNENGMFYNDFWNMWRDDMLIRWDLHSSYDKHRITTDDTLYFERIVAFDHNMTRVGMTVDHRDEGNEHMWEELNGIFGPDSVRVERHAMITPFPTEKRAVNAVVNGSRAVDFSTMGSLGNPIILDEGTPKAAFSKGQYCPYPGDWIYNSPAAPKGESSSGSNKKKDVPSKRFLDF